MAFPNISNQVDFPALEQEILAFWQEHDTFKKSLEQRKGGEEFVFYDGPPFATGLPHYGHLLAGTIKDVVPRYQTMLGKYVERRFGWDTHGLPIEALAQDALKINGAYEIKA
ncbi:MAG: class I tRNA ligase family protein, partial [Lentisphaeria bacterium]|nr:class I tRNA ligase family protein [Lentisphaeria bacterium]